MLRARGSTDPTVGGGKVRGRAAPRGAGNGKGSGGVASGYAVEVMADNPTVYFRFGESAGSTIPVNSGSLGGTGAYNNAVPGQPSLLTNDTNFSASFPGTINGFVPFVGADYANNFTLEALIHPTNITADRAIISQGSNGYCFRQDTGKLQFLKSTVALIGETGVVIAINTTYHVAMTLSSTGAWIIYLNGSSVASGSGAPTNFDGSTGMTIGRDQGASFFVGRIDEVAVYNTVLSPARIAAHAAAR